MKDLFSKEFEEKIIKIVGSKKIITDKRKTLFYRTGIRVGSGLTSMVVFPQTLLQLWKVLKICIEFNKIIILQAANTGLTGGSTPYGDDYDRDVVIINTLTINQLIIINNGSQVIAFPGTTLYQLEDKLSHFSRSPHSVIGSSCIGASVVGGICNNSGGNLVNRGPAYTELSLFAKLNKSGELELINHLDIKLGKTPEEIFANLESSNFNQDDIYQSKKIASDTTYHERVRDINASSPARFNADERRLYESSGCAGKIAVFAVRLDTFPNAKKEQVFFVGTNQPSNFSILREKILTEFEYLPEMGEYMHRSYFEGAEKYCKDTFLFLKYFGSKSLPKLLFLKRYIDQFAKKLTFLPDNLTDWILQIISDALPSHLPKRLRDFNSKFDHYFLLLASDKSIPQAEDTLENLSSSLSEFEYFKCTTKEGRDALLHRYVAGAAPARYQVINKNKSSGELLPLDIALPRNCSNWYEILPEEILSQMAESFQMGHFLCMVFHLDFVLKKGVDANKLKSQILKILDKNKAKYPAEHNVGHIYKAEKPLVDFYQNLDPTNTFNSGIGMTSKKKNYS